MLHLTCADYIVDYTKRYIRDNSLLYEKIGHNFKRFNAQNLAVSIFIMVFYIY